MMSFLLAAAAAARRLNHKQMEAKKGQEH